MENNNRNKFIELFFILAYFNACFMETYVKKFCFTLQENSLTIINLHRLSTSNGG